MLDYTIFGESHGPAVGVLVTGAAPGLPVDREIIARELERRAPGGPLALSLIHIWCCGWCAGKSRFPIVFYNRAGGRSASPRC